MRGGRRAHDRHTFHCDELVHPGKLRLGKLRVQLLELSLCGREFGDEILPFAAEPRLTVSYVIFDKKIWEDMVAELEGR